MVSKKLLGIFGRIGKEFNYYKDPIFWDRKLGYKNALRIAEAWALINEYAPLSVIQAVRTFRLNELISSTYKNIPFYTELYRACGIDFVNFFEEKNFQRLPLVKKNDLRSYIASEKYHGKNIPSRRRREAMTSGSTGEPFIFFLDNAYTTEMIAMGNRIWRWAGEDAKAPKILCAPESAKNYYQNLIYFPHSSLHSRMKENLEVIRSAKAELIFGTPVMAFDFLLTCANAGEPIRVRKAILGGHIVTPGIRKYFLETFGCEVFEFYAAAETRMIGLECEEHNGLHIQEENLIVEIADENGSPLPPGKVGKVVVTSLSNEVMPFIRYELGDLGKILPHACPCGRTSRLLQVQGRTNEPLFLAPDGSSVAPSVLRDILDPFFSYFYRYQFIQKSRVDFLLKVIPAASYTEEFAMKAIEGLKKEIGHTASISLECVPEIPPLPNRKFQYFISSLWKEKFPTALFDVPELKDGDQ